MSYFGKYPGAPKNDKIISTRHFGAEMEAIVILLKFIVECFTKPKKPGVKMQDTHPTFKILVIWFTFIGLMHYFSGD